ncbi:hypothetical protein Tco_1102545 [Tanacetum coccineum]
MPGNLSEMMILGRPFLATIHARINVFRGEISLGTEEDRIIFDMNGNVHHSMTPVEKIFMINEFKKYAELSDTNENIGSLGSFDNLKEPRFEQKKMPKIMDSGLIMSRWHDNERRSVTGNDMKFVDFLQVLRNGEFEFCPTCNPDLKVCNGGDKIHGLDRHGNIIMRECDRDDKIQNEKREEMLFPDLLLINYGNSKIDDTVRARRYIKWCDENNIPLDYPSTSIPYRSLAPRNIINPSHQEDPILSIKSYFPTSSSVRRDKPQPRNYSFDEWLKVKIGHTNVDKSVMNALLNKWLLDSFDIKADFEGIHNDPYSRSLDEYTSVFDKDIEQLENEYELKIGKKGYILDDIWEKCEQVHRGTSDPCHDEVHEEVERGKSGRKNKYYDPPLVYVETFEVKQYSFDVGKSFVGVTKQLKEDLPLGQVNGTMFRGMI